MIGKTILHYKILKQIGQGGLGVVYKAEDMRLKLDTLACVVRLCARGNGLPDPVL